LFGRCGDDPFPALLLVLPFLAGKIASGIARIVGVKGMYSQFCAFLIDPFQGLRVNQGNGQGNPQRGFPGDPFFSQHFKKNLPRLPTGYLGIIFPAGIIKKNDPVTGPQTKDPQDMFGLLPLQRGSLGLKASGIYEKTSKGHSWQRSLFCIYRVFLVVPEGLYRRISLDSRSEAMRE
jgi:hypothetical protein